MNWTNLGWLLIGIGLGAVISRWWQRRSVAPRQKPQPQPKHQNAQPADVQALQSQLQQTQLAYQMATEISQFKAGFLARISHELRSPLNGMIGMHQLILSDLCDSREEEREFIEQANQSTLKMVKLLDEIIDVSKAEHGTSQLDIQPVQLATLLQEVQTQTHLQAKNRNLHLQVFLPDPDLYVLADPRRLRQVLVSLTTAAIADMQEGSITVSVHPDVESGAVHIWIEDQRSPTVWQDAIALLQTPPAQQFTFPSPGLNLLANQTLLELMQGRLELLAIASEPLTPTSFNRLQCSIPLVIPDEA
jgi:signal transduction histidine kinase